MIHLKSSMWASIFCFSSKSAPTESFFDDFAKFFDVFALTKIVAAARNFLEIIAGVGAIETVQESSKSEPSSRFFGRLKFSAVFPVQAGRGPVNG